MIVRELLDKVRVKLADTSEPYLWSYSDLLGCLNSVLSIIEAAEVFLVVEPLSCTTGIFKYTLPSTVSKVAQIVDLNKMRIEDIVFNVRQDSEINKMSKPHWWAVVDRQVYVYPIPDSDYVFDMLVYPSWFIVSIDEELPFYDECLVDGVCWRAYLTEDTEAFDLKLLVIMKAVFIMG